MGKASKEARAERRKQQIAEAGSCAKWREKEAFKRLKEAKRKGGLEK